MYGQELLLSVPDLFQRGENLLIQGQWSSPEAQRALLYGLRIERSEQFDAEMQD